MSANGSLDMDKAGAFAFKVVGDVTAQQMGPLTTIGDRLGLCVALAHAGPLTSAELAARAGDADGVAVTRTERDKCGRCWRHLPEVSEDGALCARCDEVVNG